MKALKVLGIVIAVVLAILLGIGLFLPDRFHVERSVVMKSKRECPYDQVVDLEKSLEWSPWRHRGAAREITFGEIKRGAGASYSWTTENGRVGSFEIVAVEENASVETRVDLGDAGQARGYWTFERDGLTTEVTWALEGEAQGILDRYFMLLAEPMVGPDFGEGLARIKQVCER